MKILHVHPDNIDDCFNSLNKTKSIEFINGGYTHIECRDRINIVEVFTTVDDPIVFIGEDIGPYSANINED